MTRTIMPCRLGTVGAAIAILAAALVVSPAPDPVEASESSGARGFQRHGFGPEQERVPNSWIVVVEDGTDPSREGPELAREYGGRARHTYDRVLRGFSFRGSEHQARDLAEDGRVRKVIPDYEVRAFGDTIPTGIQRIRARHPSGSDAHSKGHTGSGTRIAILDTGIDPNHPDLNVNMSLGKNCVGSGPPSDNSGHGTHIAGTAAAVVNGGGVVGVAPDAELVPVKVLDSGGTGSWATIICGIDHVTSRSSDIDVANMSLGGGGGAGSCTDGGLREAICRSVSAGVTYTVAAGNGSTNAGGLVPARYPEVITVSAIDDDTFASFSNYGSVIDVTAPGVRILSTHPGGNYGTRTGTSMSAPHVAGVAALVLANDPGLSPSQVKSRLQATGECPNGAFNSGGSTCSGQGQWAGDPDGIPEPLVHALCAVSTGESPFTDLCPGHIFFDEIVWMDEEGLATGFKDGTFRPGVNVARQSMAAFLYRLAGEPSGPHPDPGFSDVDSDHPFFTEIAWLVDAGIATGFDDRTFRPGFPVARQSTAAFLYRFAGEPPGPHPDPGFSDVDSDHPFFTEIAWLVDAGIATGFKDGTFRTQQDVTRMAAAAFLYRFVNG